MFVRRKKNHSGSTSVVVADKSSGVFRELKVVGVGTFDTYQNLWNVERSFRITNGTLDVRPMFHFTARRIEAHVCICFVALKVYKELERLLKQSGCTYSVDEVLRIAETVVTIEIARPENNDTETKTLCLTDEERAISYLIETDDWLNL